MSRARSHRVDCGDVELHVEERGEGRALLVLHGFTGSIESMQTVCDALAARHRVLAVDLVGHGASSAPRSRDAYAMERCVEQLLAVLRTLAGGSAAVLGYSMGGRAALSLLARQPQAVTAAVLVGASAGLESPEERHARMLHDEALARRIEDQGLERFVDEWMALPLFASQAQRLSPEARARARAQRLSNRAHGLANSLRGMGTGAQPPLHALLPGLRRPVLLAVGCEDAKFEGIARDLAARLPDARIARIPEAGHAAHLENAEAFVHATEAFLADAEAA